MKKISVIVLAAFFGVIFLTHCAIVDKSDRDEIDREIFTVKIDSLETPETISSSDSLNIRIGGFIGPNGCHYLKEIQQDRDEGLIAIQGIGERVTGPVGCTAALVELDSTITVAPPFQPGSFTVRVQQPDSSFLSRTVEVQ